MLARDAIVGTVIRTGVERRSPRAGRRWSSVEHYATVDHLYGPNQEHKWIVPLCGAAPGKAGVADTGELCKVCAGIEQHRVIQQNATIAP